MLSFVKLSAGATQIQIFECSFFEFFLSKKWYFEKSGVFSTIYSWFDSMTTLFSVIRKMLQYDDGNNCLLLQTKIKFLSSVLSIEIK